MQRLNTPERREWVRSNHGKLARGEIIQDDNSDHYQHADDPRQLGPCRNPARLAKQPAHAAAGDARPHRFFHPSEAFCLERCPLTIGGLALCASFGKDRIVACVRARMWVRACGCAGEREWVCGCARVGARVWVCERERARIRAPKSLCVRARVCVCGRACMRASVKVCVCV